MDNKSYEHNVALRESSRIQSNDEYFKARPQIDNHDRRNVFDAGYDRGWQAAQQQSASEIAELKEKINQFEKAMIPNIKAMQESQSTPVFLAQGSKLIAGHEGVFVEDKHLKEIVSYHETHCLEIDQEITELKVDNERLREALKYTLYSLEGRGIPPNVDPVNLTTQFYRCKDVLRKALSATPSQSLQAHDNPNKTMAGACGGQAGSFRVLKGKQ